MGVGPPPPLLDSAAAAEPRHHGRYRASHSRRGTLQVSRMCTRYTYGYCWKRNVHEN